MPTFKLVAAPVQYNEQPAAPGQAPKFNEHGDQILAELGFDDEAISRAPNPRVFGDSFSVYSAQALICSIVFNGSGPTGSMFK